MMGMAVSFALFAQDFRGAQTQPREGICAVTGGLNLSERFENSARNLRMKENWKRNVVVFGHP
jgi:hypothetical protein